MNTLRLGQRARGHDGRFAEAMAESIGVPVAAFVVIAQDAHRAKEQLRMQVDLAHLDGHPSSTLRRELSFETVDELLANRTTLPVGRNGQVHDVHSRLMQLVHDEAAHAILLLGHHALDVVRAQAADELVHQGLSKDVLSIATISAKSRGFTHRKCTATALRFRILHTP